MVATARPTETRDERCPAPETGGSRATTMRLDHYLRPAAWRADLDEKEWTMPIATVRGVTMDCADPRPLTRFYQEADRHGAQL